MTKQVVVTAMLVATIAHFGMAQTGSLKGRALDVGQGKPIPNFQVQIEALKKQTKTDSAGKYRLSNLPPGNYRIKTAHPKYGRFTIDSVIIKANQVTTRNITVDQHQSKFRQDSRVRIEKKLNQSSAGYVNPRKSVRRQYNREDYDRIEANTFKNVKSNPLSTFSIDVDRASYANTRRFLENQELPPKDAVRIEELINYFDYNYEGPDGNRPFAVNAEGGKCPWNPEHQLLHIGLQGKKIPQSEIPPSNLVFLVDVSGSMNSPNKLPLVKASLRMLTDQLGSKDRISMVAYAGSSGLVLPSTPGKQKAKITKAINNLEAGGSTAGSKGIKLAYKQAKENFIEDGNNRVILATDGDFNVGVTSDGALTRLIEEKRESGIFLSVLGFGTGNYQGSKMEKLSNKGNGNYTYVDNKLEAKKTLVEEFGGTMTTIAKDVKIQVEFNPVKVQAYRLIGYVNRQLDKEEFRNDSVDAGELGAGHSVTALYELIPSGEASDQKQPSVPDLRYQEQRVKDRANQVNEIGILKLRYKEPDGKNSKLIKQPLKPTEKLKTTNNFYWASAVAMFGMQLRNSSYKGETSYNLIKKTAKHGLGTDAKGYRKGFMMMIKQAANLERSQF